jgi:branched-chain amino acid transport system substrate-binding protein
MKHRPVEGFGARLLIAAAALIGALGVSPALAEDLVLGLTYAKTGRYASVGAPTEVAVDIAVAEINGAGGVNGRKIRIEKFDTASEPRNAQVAVQRFAEDQHALAVIGPFSSQESQVAFAAGERLEIVQMPNASSAPGMTKNRKWAWRMTEDEGKQYARLLQSVAAKRLVKDRTAAVFYPADEVVGKSLGTDLMPKLLAANGWAQVISPEGFPTNAADLAPFVTKLTGKTPEVISFSGLPEAAVKLMKEVRRQGHNSRLIGSQIFADPDIAQKLGPDGEGAIFASWYWWDFNDRTRTFEGKFIAEARRRGLNKSGAHHVDASAYDIVYVFADAMKRSGVTGNPDKVREEREAIRGALAATDLEGVTGHICFDSDHDAELAAYVIGVHDQKRFLIDAHPADGCSAH